jgi:hypothetical protein
MTLFYTHHDRLHDMAGEVPLRVLARRAVVRVAVAFKILHHAIVTAKTRRAQQELMVHEIPQQPLILGDKWDF